MYSFRFRSHEQSLISVGLTLLRSINSHQMANELLSSNILSFFFIMLQIFLSKFGMKKLDIYQASHLKPEFQMNISAGNHKIIIIKANSQLKKAHLQNDHCSSHFGSKLF